MATPVTIEGVPPVKLYVDLMSQPSRALILFCRATSIDHEVHLVQIGKGENRSPEYLAVNPLGKVPAMDDNGFVLWESQAILQYLADTRHVPNHWYPRGDPRARANVDRMLHYHHLNTRAGCAGVGWHRVVAPRIGLPSNPGALQEAERTLKNTLKFLDTTILSKHKFLCGDQITIADISAACEFANLAIVPYDFSAYRNVYRWFEDVQKELNGWDEVHTIVNKVAAKRSKL